MQKLWVDDMLDLYNAALSIGDLEWAASVLGTLQAGYEASEQGEWIRKRELLQKRLAEIDARLYALRREFEQTASTTERQQLYEVAIRLQVERAQIEEERKKYADSINS